MGWTWLDTAFEGVPEDAVEAEMDRREPSIKMVVGRIQLTRIDRERRSFARQAAAEEGFDRDEPDFDTDEEAAAFYLKQDTMVELEHAEEERLLAQLRKLGARMQRPYEHWNEDERLMEYMERDR